MEMHPKAHPELITFVGEATRPSLATKAMVHTEITPAFKIAAQAKAQAAHFRTLLTLAELAPHDHRLDAKFEHIHQTADVIDREATNAVLALRNLAQAMTQWERYAGELPAHLNNLLDRGAHDAPAVS